MHLREKLVFWAQEDYTWVVWAFQGTFEREASHSSSKWYDFLGLSVQSHIWKENYSFDLKNIWFKGFEYLNFIGEGY